MNIKTLSILILTLFQLSICSAQKKDTTFQKIILEERARLKKYAFCACLFKSYPSDSLLLKDGSAAGYFELSKYDADVFTEVNQLAGSFSKKIYSSKHNRPLALMKCLDFYNSAELEHLIKKFDKRIDLSGGN